MRTLIGLASGAVRGAAGAAMDVTKTLAMGAISRSVIASASLSVAHGAVGGVRARIRRGTIDSSSAQQQEQPESGGRGMGGRASSILLRIEGILHAQEQLLGEIPVGLESIRSFLGVAVNRLEAGAARRHNNLIGAISSLSPKPGATRFDQPNLLSRFMGGAGDALGSLVSSIQGVLGGVLGGLKLLGSALLGPAGAVAALAAVGVAGFKFGQWLDDKFGISDKIVDALLPDSVKNAGSESAQDAHSKSLERQAKIELYGVDASDEEIDPQDERYAEVQRRKDELTQEYIAKKQARRGRGNLSKVPMVNSMPDVGSKPTSGPVQITQMNSPNVSVSGSGGGQGGTTVNQFYSATPITESAPAIAGSYGD